VTRDYEIIREMGCTGVRLAHYQHPSYEYSLCDQLGLVTWAELALVNRIGPPSAFADNARQQLRELIKQNYNHPSICFWSLWNELGPRDQIVLPEQTKVLNSLNDLAHQLDPKRLTTAASHLPTDNPVHLIPDVIAFNKYFGWYSGTAEDWAAELDKMRSIVPGDHAIGISEYGAGASIKQHEARPTTRPRTGGAWHPEQWQNLVHEQAWAAMKDRPWLWGTFLWVMFDFASDGRSEGDQFGINDKGLVTRDRRVRKDAFYLYKANWSDEPFVHITSRRFSPRRAGPAEVKVYSNCESVELFVNGRSLGRKTAADHVFVWPDVKLSSGKAKLRALGVFGGNRGKEPRDEVAWQVSPSAATRLGTTQP
jgi:beta-galactosidase